MKKILMLVSVIITGVSQAQIVPLSGIDETLAPNGFRRGMVSISAEETVEIDQSFRIWVFEGVCPNRLAGVNVWPTWRNHVMACLRGQAEQATNVVPDRFHVATMGAWWHLVVDPKAGTSMWLGQLTPGGFQKGNGIGFATVIKNTNLFALAEVRLKMWSWDVAKSLAFNPVLTNYSSECQGVRYGPSGVFGPDSVLVTSGPATQLVNEIFYVGSRLSYAASDQVGINVIRDYIGSVTNYGLSCQVDIVRNGIVIARKLRELPFFPMPAEIFGIALGTGEVFLTGQGVPNQLYWMEGATSMGAEDWRFEALAEAGTAKDKLMSLPIPQDRPVSTIFRLSQTPY
ncbi:MAG TPA: hypothetical protein VJI33_00010 [Candidatus Paceibacterota bacterium]